MKMSFMVHKATNVLFSWISPTPKNNERKIGKSSSLAFVNIRRVIPVIYQDRTQSPVSE